MKVIRVRRTEFELENGEVFPIAPPLEEDMTPDEFQEYYDFADTVVQGIRSSRSDDPNASDMGQNGKDSDQTEPRGA